MFNIQKFNTFLAVDECNSADVPATLSLVSVLTGIQYFNMSSKLSRYCFQGYLKRKACYCNDRFSGNQYSLTKKGKSVLEKFSIRMSEGHDLNIRCKPKPFDWSKVELLPGLHLLEEMKKEKRK